MLCVVSGHAVDASTSRRVDANLAGEIAQLYVSGETWSAIASATQSDLSTVHHVLSDLFSEGLPRLNRRRVTDAQVRAAYSAYLRGERSLAQSAKAHGVHRSTFEHRLRALGLVKKRRRRARPARNAVQAEQQAITARLVQRIDELRAPRRFTLGGLACASGLSVGAIDHLRYELGDPRLTTILHLCRGLNVTPGELLDALPLPTQPRAPHLSQRSGVS